MCHALTCGSTETASCHECFASQHRNSQRLRLCTLTCGSTKTAFCHERFICFFMKCHRGFTPVPPRTFCKKFDQKLYFYPSLRRRRTACRLSLLLKKVDENFNLKTLAFSISSAAGWFASAVWQLFIGPKHTYSRTQKDRRIFLRSFWVL